jgi:FkbH-like protein
MNLIASTIETATARSWAPRLAAANAASEAREWHRAAGLWDALRADFPHDPRCWYKAGEAYCETGMFEQADRVLGEALGLFPDDEWTAYWSIIVARRKADWPEVLRRAERMRQAVPGSWRAWVETANALAELGHRAESEKLRREAVHRFPDEFWTNFGAARLDADGSDPAEAIRIWSELVARFPTQPAAIEGLRAGEQRLAKAASPPDVFTSSGPVVQAVADREYRCPTDLAISDTPLKQVMVIGSCLSAGWPMALEGKYPGCAADHFMVNNAAMLPEAPPCAPEAYDFHLIQMPLRQILPERTHFGLSYSDPKAFEQLFEAACGRLSDTLAELMRWNKAHGILTFVCNFLVPQQNPRGRLLPRYDLRNFQFFIEKLNQALEEELRQYQNAYLFDFDQIVSTYGRRYLQDDAVWTISHGAALSNTGWEDDQARLEPIDQVTRYYPVSTHAFVLHAWAELIAMVRTIRQADMVKLVLVDLDDTLWRGVAAEQAELSSVVAIEGWPLGVAEALMFLKSRGVLLGIVSKNDETRVRDIWRRIYGTRVRLEDFAAVKINWRPKAENIEEILAQVNLLPKSVVFVDDNPVERAAVKAAFPEMRVLGPNPYLWRRILLWSPETQVATITSESAARTEMVQQQVKREEQRQRLSREDFLASLGVRATVSEFASTVDRRFPRTLELINKTNQFNTTGKRWTSQECESFFRDGGAVFVLEVADRYTAYGLVGVLLVRGGDIVQFVMSCRVVGMDVEIAAVGGVLQVLAGRGIIEYGTTLELTSANLLCRDLWERCGFAAAGEGRYRRAGNPPLLTPAHIELQLDAVERPVLSAAE